MWLGKFPSNKTYGNSPSLCFRRLLLFFITIIILSSCQKKSVNPNANLSLQDFSELRNTSYEISYRNIRRQIMRMVAADSDSTISDYYARTYYIKHHNLIWIDRKGIDHRADTLLKRLQEVREAGLNPAQFRISQIKHDLKLLRDLNVAQTGSKGISSTMARLEYNLTKAFFRFSAGQRFGYVNPNQVLNRLDVKENTPDAFYTLYDLGSPYAKRSFYRQAVAAVHSYKLTEFLADGEPRNPYYRRLVNLLNSDSASYYGRQLILVNMERCRWRMKDYPTNHSKYILVNIPSMHLRAVDGDKELTMRIGCGALKTKTPLLASNIFRIDINPQWIIPRSIVKKSIIPRLGNSSYFASKHYFIRDRSTGRNVPLAEASAAALLDGSQLAIQEGGEGNALGRIIFRFDNNFSIYLHDTSSREVFERADRDVSHGCIRVEKPFQLAVFLIGEDDKGMTDRVWYSINADVSPLGKKYNELTEQQRAVADTLKRKKLIGKVNVKPNVPLFIWYYTLFPTTDGRLQAYPDLYGYDTVIYNQLRNYL